MDTKIRFEKEAKGNSEIDYKIYNINIKERYCCKPTNSAGVHPEQLSAPLSSQTPYLMS